MFKNRGRIQAQGGGIEESEAWAQDSPPTAEDGLQMVDDLMAKLTPKDAKLRTGVADKIRRTIRNAPKTGDIDAPISLSKEVPGNRNGERIDLEVTKGKAFI